MVYWVRTFGNTRTGETFEVASNEQYLPPLRRRIVKECGGKPDWENESIVSGASRSHWRTFEAASIRLKRRTSALTQNFD